MYIKLTDGTPKRYSLRTLRLDNPNTSFPNKPTDELLVNWDVYPYVEKVTPTHNSATQVVEHNGYVETGGIYRDAYVVRDKTDEELYAELSYWRTNAYMSRRDFAVLSANSGWITKNEAKAWAGGNTIPPIATNVIATLPAGNQFAMEMSVLTRTRIWRTDSLVLMLMAVKEVAPTQMDLLFGRVLT
jgi:hypothetical protein